MPEKIETIQVLIVDDHPIVRDGIQTNLEDATAVSVVGEASSGEEALKLAEQLQPHVIIMDIKLTDMTGIELLHKIQPVAPNSKVLILSMYDEKNYVLQSVKAGARGYLLKENSPDNLLNAVLQVHRGGAYFDPSVSDFLLKPEIEEESEDVELTEREKEVLILIAEGYSNKEIAAKLFLSVRTIEAHRENLMRKLDIHGTAALTRHAIENGYIQVDIHPDAPSLD